MLRLRTPKSSFLVLFSLLSLLLSACGTYNDKIRSYYSDLYNERYSEANAELDKNKLLQKNRNRLLFYFEKGRIEHVLKNYQNSNLYFNLADSMIEVSRTSAADVVAGTLVNPMMQKYKGEDFEKIMIHYYKALNYLYLNETDEAIVEARRITLQNQQLEDKFKGKSNRYFRDAFAEVLQGLIYESNGDENNAFIAYRNAIERYQAKDDSLYYGIHIPLQLKKDVIRSASLSGFQDQVDYFSRLFNMKHEENNKPYGELVIFWENGLAPVKQEQDIVFSLTKGMNSYYFLDPYGTQIPVHSGFSFNPDRFSAGDLNNFRIAFPTYRTSPLRYSFATASANTDTLRFERAEDITNLAKATLRQRYVKEVSLALSRLAVKKAAQFAIRGNSSNSKKNDNLREGLSAMVDLYSLISEKADTRNWQTLPSEISYLRMPLKAGKNEITLTMTGNNGAKTEKVIAIEGKPGLQFFNFATIQ